MNKMNIAILTSLMLCGVNSAFSMGLEQREILYTLNDLGQNLADVPMVVQNVDMFMGIIAMNIQLNEAKLNGANSTFKKALVNNAATIAGCVAFKTVLNLFVKFMVKRDYDLHYRSFQLLKPIQTGITWLSPVAQGIISLNLYNAWQNRSVLAQALALDKEILVQLEEIKGYVDHNDQPAGNFLLETAAQS